MKKAFSIIELVFVIAIMGVIVSIAFSKYNETQDDAYIALERSSIAAARSSILVYQNFKYTHTSASFKQVFLTNKDGDQYQCKVYFDSNSTFPFSLSVQDTTANGTTDNNVTTSTTLGDHKALAICFTDVADLNTWTSSGLNIATRIETLKGPASNGVTNVDALIHTGMEWRYNNQNGKITLQTSTTP